MLIFMIHRNRVLPNVNFTCFVALSQSNVLWMSCYIGVTYYHYIVLQSSTFIYVTSAGHVPVRICPLNGYWSQVHSFEYKS